MKFWRYWSCHMMCFRLSISAILFVLVSCGGAIEGLSKHVFEAPKVVSTNPSSGQSAVPIKQKITITFSESMDPATLTSTAISINNNVTGSISYDNETKSVTITPDNTFLYNTDYTVSVNANAKDAGGNSMKSNFSWSFRTYDPPVLQVADFKSSATYTTPALVFNTAGDGLAVWEVSSKYASSLVYAHYTVSTDTWSNEQIMATFPYSLSSRPRVATNGTGFAVVWERRNQILEPIYNPGRDILANIYKDGAWLGAKTLDENDGRNNNPLIAANATGYMVVWRREDAFNSGVFSLEARQYDGNQWQNPAVLDEGAPSVNGGNYFIASNQQGYAVAWIQSDGSFDRVYAKVFDGNWSTLTLVDNLAAHASELVMASNSSGYQLAWTQMDGTIKIKGRGFSVLNNWDLNVVNINGASVNNASTAKIATNGTNYSVAWLENVGGVLDLYAAFGTNEIWSTPPALLDEQANDVVGHTVVSNGDGYGYSWRQLKSDQKYSIHAVIYTTTWDKVEEIDNSSETVSAQVMTSSGTRYAVSWLQFDSSSSGYQARAQIYDTTWPGAHSLETSFSTVSRPPFIIAKDNGGEFSISWYQQDQDKNAGIRTGTYTTVWNSETNLASTPHGGSSAVSELQSDKQGNTMLAWTQFHNGRIDLYASSHANNVWGATQLIATDVKDTVKDTTDLKNVENRNQFSFRYGDGFILVWLQDKTPQLMARIHDGSQWGDAVMLNEGNGNPIPNFYVAANAGGFGVVWQQSDGSSDRIYSRLYQNKTWTSAEFISDSIASQPKITTNGETFMAIWLEQDPVLNTILNLKVNLFQDNQWRGQNLVEQQVETISNHHIVASNTDYYIVWSTNPGLANFDLFVTSYSSGDWLTADLWTKQQGMGLIGVTALRGIKIISNGKGFGIAWKQDDALFENNIYANSYIKPNWRNEKELYRGSVGSTASPVSIASSADGYAVIWHQTNGILPILTYSIQTSIYTNGWQDGIPIISTENPTYFENYLPSVVGNGSGGYALVWNQANGTHYDIRKSVFNGINWEAGVVLQSSDAEVILPDLIWDGFGYAASWVQPSPGDDPIISYPWAKMGFSRSVN